MIPYHGLVIPITFLQEQPTWQCTPSPKNEILAKNYVLIVCYEFTPLNFCRDIFWVVSVSQAPSITDEFAMSMGWAPWGGPYSHRCGPSGFEVRTPKKSCDLKSLGESQKPAKQGPMILRAGVFSCCLFCWLLLGVWETGLWQNRRVFFKVGSKGIYLYTWPLLPGSLMWRCERKNDDLFLWISTKIFQWWFLLAKKNRQKGWPWWQPVRIFGAR